MNSDPLLRATLLAFALAVPCVATAQASSPAAQERKASERKATADARKARRACEQMTDAQQKRKCLSDARAKQAQARKKPPAAERT